MIFCANWPAVRIQAWETLLPARAIENQCFVLGVNRTGADGNQKLHNGKSQLLDPLGICIDNIGEAETTAALEIEQKKIHSVRNEFPFLRDSDNFELLK
jgi:predicted amidohydrolase